MSVSSLQKASSAPDGSRREHAKFSRIAWACLPVMLALSAAVLLLFGFSWWTALGAALLLACPASAAVAYYLRERADPRPPKSNRDV
jgi:membrane protein implicated in regulation of membrane protease activity